jgi:hypothetical protein
MADSTIYWRGIPGLIAVEFELRTRHPAAHPLNNHVELTESDVEPGCYGIIIPEPLIGLYRWDVKLEGMSIDSGWISLQDSAGPFHSQSPFSPILINQPICRDSRKLLRNAINLRTGEGGTTRWFDFRDESGLPLEVPIGAEFNAKSNDGETICDSVPISRDGASWALAVPAELVANPTRGVPLLWSLRVSGAVIAEGPLFVGDAA